MKRLGFAALLLAAACTEPEPEVSQEVELVGSDRCDVAAFEPLVGRPKEAVDGIITPEIVRVVSEDAIITMDYQPERLNVFHDKKGNITRVTCG